jgi:hypothetical protein
MIANQILANASSAVYQSRAMQQAAEALRPDNVTKITPNIGNQLGVNQAEIARYVENTQEIRRTRDNRSTSLSFSDIYTSQLSLSSVGFLQAFGTGEFRRQDAQSASDKGVTGQGYRQYRAAQEESRAVVDDVEQDEFDFETIDNENVQQVLPPMRDYSQRMGAESSTAKQFSASPEFVLQDDFAMARISYNKATDLRTRAFASPPSINLLG